MRQQVNLYARAFIKEKIPLAAGQILVVAALAFVLLGAWAVWSTMQAGDADGELQQLRNQRDAQIEQVNELAERTKQLQADPALQARLERLRERVAAKQRMLAALTEHNDEYRQGFSDYLAALGRRHPQGLWLTNVRVDHGGRDVRLAGRVLAPAQVPEYLERLQQEAVFDGRVFRRFSIGSGDESDGNEASGPGLEFVISTACLADADADELPAECRDVVVAASESEADS